MSEQTSNPTSGQNVPKSKFRRKSRQEQTTASKLRMERRGEKLDAAREKLAKQKPPKKPGAVKRLAHTAGHGVHGFVHGKLYEVEHENVGTEGAHRSELAAESVYRFGRRKLRKAIREHPAKAVERAESKHIKATADYYYRKTVEEHPEMQEGGAVSQYLQKQKIKRQYAKQAREAARQTAKAAEGTASVTGKLAEKVSAYIKEHPGGLLLLLAAFLLLVVLQSCMSSLVTVGNGVAGAIGASTYAAEDADLLEPRPPIALWRTSCNATSTPTTAPTIMTSIILTSTPSNTIPMCCCPSSVRSMRASGRWTRCGGRSKCSLTASTF